MCFCPADQLTASSYHRSTLRRSCRRVSAFSSLLGRCQMLIKIKMSRVWVSFSEVPLQPRGDHKDPIQLQKDVHFVPPQLCVALLKRKSRSCKSGLAKINRADSLFSQLFITSETFQRCFLHPKPPKRSCMTSVLLLYFSLWT